MILIFTIIIKEDILCKKKNNWLNVAFVEFFIC